MRMLLFLALGGTMWGQFAPPRVGMLRDANGQVRNVWGMAGNFALGDPGQDGVLTVASSGARTVVKDAATIQIRNEAESTVCSQDAEDGPVKAAVSNDGRQAVIFLPNSGAWQMWREGDCGFVLLDIAIDGTVQDVALENGKLSVLAIRDGQVWRLDGPTSDWSQRQEQLLDGVSPTAAFAGNGAVVWLQDGALVRRNATGEESRADFAGDVSSFSSLGRGWLAVNAADGTQWALRTDRDTLQLYLLPGVQQ